MIVEKKKHLIILLGAPGSGKGTISQYLKKAHGWTHLSTGNLCRKHIAQQTDIGKSIDFTIKSGKLVCDTVITEMVYNWFKNNINHESVVVLDGFPRTKEQAKTFYTLLNSDLAYLNVYIVILNVPDNEIIKRLASRCICSNEDCQKVYSCAQPSKETERCAECDAVLVKRSDDQDLAIAKRLDVYHKNEADLLKYYQSIGVLPHAINANQPVETVVLNIMELLGPKIEDQ